jgi:PAS domain S-box-containing protein
MAEPRIRILNVDDYVPGRYARTQVLQRAGFEVVEASTGAEALRIVAEDSPDLVLLDVNLPDIDGFEVCRRLREQLGTLTIPVIHISSTFVNERAQQLAMDGGADAFLTDPVEPPVLLATVHALLRLRRAEQGLRAAGRRWQATFDAIRDGICLLSADGTVLQCNAAFAKLVELAPQDLVGVPWASLWGGFGSPEAAESLARLGQSRRRESVELPHEGGWVRLLVDPVVETGALAGMVGIASDITIERQVAEARAVLLAREQAAREDAEAANRAKDEFLAMLSHELRNPLDVIASAVHVLDAISSKEPRAVHTREVITQQVRQLARLVDDLLDVTRVTTGKIGLVVAPLDLAEIVARCVRTLTDAGQTSRHDVALSSEPVWVEADKSRLEQIIMNLLSNGLKYTPAGGSMMISVGGDGRTARLVVKDTGAGIPPEMRDRIFDLFYQGRRTLDRAEGGLGIGLTLVRRLVELHGGRIEVASEGPGRGSTFTVELPQIPAAVVSESPDQDAPSVTRRTILLVEDNKDSREMLKYLLELAGHDVHEAASGPAGFEAIFRLGPDVALVDLGLPGFDGFELARRVRAEPGGGAVRLVALTGYGLPDDQRRSREAGFDAHLVKPVDPARLAAVIAGPPRA